MARDIHVVQHPQAKMAEARALCERSHNRLPHVNTWVETQVCGCGGVERTDCQDMTEQRALW